MATNSNCLTRIDGKLNVTMPLPQFAHLALVHERRDSIDFRIEGTWPWWSLSRVLADALTDWDESLGKWEVMSAEAPGRKVEWGTIANLLSSGRLTPETMVGIGQSELRPIAYYLAAEQDVDLSVILSESKGEGSEAEVSADFAVASQPQQNWLALDLNRAGRVLARPWFWAGALTISLGAFAYLLLEPSGADELEVRALRQLRAALDGVRTMRQAKPSTEEWAAFGQELTRDLEPFREALSRADLRDTSAKEALHWAVEYRLPAVLRDGRLQMCRAELGMELDLKQAGKLIDAQGKR